MDQSNHEKTPKKILFNQLNANKKTPIATTPKNFTTRFLLLSHNKASSGCFTPNRVVVNPFENQFSEKFHLPVIQSPSLFHAPSTPKQQNKLELFEWTIEELSNLNPVNLTPHPTQYHSDVDPAKEAEVQAAISSFFEQPIVPSPASSSSSKMMRTKRIELKNIHNSSNTADDAQKKIYNSTALPDANNSDIFKCHNNNNNNSSNKRKIIKRDISTQTALSFPPTLSKEIEDLLKQFQIDDNVNCNTNDINELSNFDENRDELEISSGNNDKSMMDISTLRRKLFMHRPSSPSPSPEHIDNDTCSFAIHLSPAPKTPELTRNRSHSIIHQEDYFIPKEFNTLKGDMFGELSPIRNDNFSSGDSSPAMSSNDVSMTSDVGREKSTPASRRFSNKLKKKRLSESFSLLQNEFNNDDDATFGDDEDKENQNQLHDQMFQGSSSKLAERKIFKRFDSGCCFNDSNSNMNLSFSTEFMQI